MSKSELFAEILSDRPDLMNYAFDLIIMRQLDEITREIRRWTDMKEDSA